MSNPPYDHSGEFDRYGGRFDNYRVGTENRTSLDNPVIPAIESFKVTSYKFRFSDETMFILPSNDFLLEFFEQLLQINK